MKKMMMKNLKVWSDEECTYYYFIEHTSSTSTLHPFPRTTMLQGMDMDAADPNQPMQTQQAMAAQAKKEKKLKPTRGGGSGFGSK